MCKIYFLILFSFILLSSVFAQTTLEKGDILLVGVNFSNNDNNCTSGTQNYFDNIYFISFKPIETGTEFEITDNGYSRVFPNYFGTSEGVVNLKRTGTTIPAGQVFSINLRGVLLLGSTSKIGNQTELNAWEVTNPVNPSLTSTLFGLNANGDQFFIMQGGIWTNSPINQGSYSGKFLFTYNSRKQWLDNQNSVNHSGFLSELNCYHITNSKASSNNSYRNFGYYKGNFSDNISKGEWLIRILNEDNWANATNCSTFTTVVPSTQLKIKGIIEQSVCSGEIEVIQETSIKNYQWFKSDNTIIGDSDDILLTSGLNLFKFNPPNQQADTYYYCRFSILGYDNSVCYFYSNLFKINGSSIPKITSIKLNN